MLNVDGSIHPLAIRKSSSPVKETKKFDILRPVAEGERALKLGAGGVICFANDLLPIDAETGIYRPGCCKIINKYFKE